jgi:hypothetical protein
MKVAVVPADSLLPIRVEEVEKINLDFLQQQVGGYIEVIDLSWPNWDKPVNSASNPEDEPEVSMWLNEEGKLNGLPFNPRASYLAQDVISPFDVIVGDVVLTGGVDDEGDSTGLSDGQIEALLSEYANNE